MRNVTPNTQAKKKHARQLLTLKATLQEAKKRIRKNDTRHVLATGGRPCLRSANRTEDLQNVGLNRERSL